MYKAMAAGLFFAAVTCAASAHAANHATKPADRAQIAHGEYLVNNIARCVDCHSPMNQRGEPIPGQMLKGAELPFAPIHPIPGWAPKSPDIAGLHGWTTQQAVHFLMTGLDRSRHRAAPPMPEYRMNRRDAEAVVAYLKSLK
jgi:mono/diheme cytochrome c family protein